MRIVSAAEAAAVVRSGDRVYLHCAAATPSVLLDALVARADELAAFISTCQGLPFAGVKLVHSYDHPKEVTKTAVGGGI